MRLIAAGPLVALLLLAACGDDSSDPTPSPTEPHVAPGQQTPNPDACLADELESDLVSTRQVRDATVITIEITNTERACVFDGPPELRWYQADGTAIGVPYTPGPDCESGEILFEDCVYAEQISLPQPALNASNSVRAIVSVTNVDALLPCASPTEQAAIIGILFPGVSLDVQVDLEAPLEIQFCSAQIDLAGYGPIGEG